MDFASSNNPVLQYYAKTQGSAATSKQNMEAFAASNNPVLQYYAKVNTPAKPAAPTTPTTRADGAGVGGNGYEIQMPKLEVELPQIRAFGAADYRAPNLKRIGNVLAAAGTGAAAGFVETAGQMTQPQGLTIGEQLRLAAQGKTTQADTMAAEQEKAQRIRENIKDPLYATADRLTEQSAAYTEKAKEGLGKVGQFAVDLGVTGTQLLGDLALGLINPALGTGAMATRVFGGSAQEARQAGATETEQQLYGLGSAATSVLVEKIANVGKAFKTAYGGSIAGGKVDDLLAKLMGKLMKNPAGQRILASAAGEAGEEALEALLQPAMQAIYDKGATLNKTWFGSTEELTDYLTDVGYNALLGGALGALGGGGNVAEPATTQTAQGGAEAAQEGRNAHVTGNETPAPAEGAQRPQNGAQRHTWGAYMEDGDIFGGGRKTRAGFTSLENAMANQFERETGINIESVESILDGLANGDYNSANWVARIAQDAKDPKMVVVAHELTHHLQTLAPQEYESFRTAVADYFTRAGGEGALTDMMNRYRSAYGAAGQNLSDSAVMDEMAADFTEVLLTDADLFGKFAQQNRTLAERLLDALRAFIEKIRATFTGRARDAAAQEATGKTISELEMIAEQWQSVYRAAAAAYGQNANTATQEGDGVRYSVKRTSKMTLAEQLRMFYNGKMAASDSFYFGQTPDALAVAGLDPLPLAFTISDFRKSAKKKHNVPRRVWNNLNNSLQNAVLAFQEGNRVGILTEDIDGDGKPLIVGIEKNVIMDREPVNAIRSAYGLDNPDMWLKNQQQKGKKYIAINKERADAFLQTHGAYSASVGENIYSTDETVPQNEEGVKRYSLNTVGAEERAYAPTFYSKMGKVVESAKQEKFGAASVVSFLKGKGIKNEEIKWSGIEEWLEGKKSVTKKELLEFINGNQLEIETETLTAQPRIEYTDAERTELDALYNEMMDTVDRVMEAWDEAYGYPLPLEMADRDYVDMAQALTRHVINQHGGMTRFSGIDTLSPAERRLYDELPDKMRRIEQRQSDIIDRAKARYGNTSETNWHEYKLDGGENYRELLFKMPNSDYRNDAMNAHWKGRSGVLAHARVQDFNYNGQPVLFVEEIQSDWHNAGRQIGYSDGFDAKWIADMERQRDLAEAAMSEAYTKHKRLEGEYIQLVMEGKYDKLNADAVTEAEREYEQAHQKYMDINRDLRSLQKKVPDAPFRDTYHEYVMKSLLRKAAEDDYGYLAWTTGKMQEDRWSSDYAEGYRIEYDQDIPKFMNKYGKKWGVKVERIKLKDEDKGNALHEQLKGFDPYDEYDIRAMAHMYLRDSDPEFYERNTDTEVDTSNPDNLVVSVKDIDTLEVFELTSQTLARIKESGDAAQTAWAIPVTEEMKESVLYEGQPRYSIKMDSDGRQLSDGQKAYFANSKVVDKSGNMAQLKSTAPLRQMMAEMPQQMMIRMPRLTTVEQDEAEAAGVEAAPVEDTVQLPQLGLTDADVPGTEPLTRQDIAREMAWRARMANEPAAPQAMGEVKLPELSADMEEAGMGLHDFTGNVETVPQEATAEILSALEDLSRDMEAPMETPTDATVRDAENLISAETVETPQSLKEKAAESWAFFKRKMVDSGEAVTQIGKAINDKYLYPFYNMARASASAGANMIAEEQTDVNGRTVGESLNAIFDPIRAKGDEYYTQFQTYMYDLHNIARMSMDQKAKQEQETAEAALAAYTADHPKFINMTEAQAQRQADSIDELEAEEAQEYLRLVRWVNRAARMGNKPVFDYDFTAEMSRGRSERLLREHPEFAQYREQVRKYIDNMMQYRVDSGLITQQDADFLREYYPDYIPTYRRQAFEDFGAAVKKKRVQIGKTVGRATGGNTKLVPLHEALGKQTMQVVREGSKNRFGARLLQDYAANALNADINRYVQKAEEYESDFSIDTFDSIDDVKPKRGNTFSVYLGGKLYDMTVDNALFEAVEALSPTATEQNTVTKVVHDVNKLYKALITGYNPTFAIRNTVRDLQTAGLYSRNFAAWAKNYPKALVEIKNDGPMWKQYKALGGDFSSVFDYMTGTVKKPTTKAGKVMDKVQALNMAMEQAPRLAEFMSVMESGDGSMESAMDAMLAAADVTVNFGRSGTWGKMLNANYVPFLNPGIQGFDKMVRYATQSRSGKQWLMMAARAAALGIAPSLINALLYRDDEEWEELRDSDKDTNYMFKLKDGLWLKIPKGRELSVLGIAADRVGDALQGEEVDIRATLNTMANQVAPANPLNQNILKAAYDTQLFDPSSPGRTWYGGDIEGQRLQNYAPGERYDSSTDVVSKAIGGALNLSPKKLNYLADQYTGVVGDIVLPLLTPQAEQDMFSKAFTVDSISSNELSSKFYEKSDELTYAKNGGDAVAAVVSRYWNSIGSDVSKLYGEIRNVENSDLSNREKKAQVQELQRQINAIQREALATVDQYTAAVESSLFGDDEDAADFAYRETNREVFGAKSALETYNKDVYAKAQEAAKNGVSYEAYYNYYFATKDIEGDKDASGKTIPGSKREKVLAEINAMDLTVEQKNALYYASGYAESTLYEAPWYTIQMPRL